MMKQWAMLPCVLVLGLSAGTCGSEDSFEAQCREQAQSGTETLDVLCECQVADGTYPDKQSCVSELTIDESVTDCYCSFYAKYPGMKEFYDCLAPAQEGLADCLKSSGCDVAKMDQCLDPYLALFMKCEVPPDAEKAEEEATEKCEPLAP